MYAICVHGIKKMAMQLSQQKLNILRQRGYSDAQIYDAVKDIEREELGKAYGSNNQQQQYTSSPSMYGSLKPSDDIARIQMLVDDILERIEHQLKEDVVVFDEKLNKKDWRPHPNPEKRVLSDLGVHKIMTHLSLYINRDTLMSDLTEQRIGEIANDFGQELKDLLFTEYEEYGMDTEDKRKEYRALVWNLTHKVYITLTRAKDGRERDTYRKMTSINMSNPLGNSMNPQMPQVAQRTRSLINPMRYFAGKYY